MTTSTTAGATARPVAADLALLLLVATAAVLEDLALLLCPLLAHALALLLTAAGWRPRPARPAPAAAVTEAGRHPRAKPTTAAVVPPTQQPQRPRRTRRAQPQAAAA